MLYQKYSLRLEGRITNKEELSSHDLEVLFYASYRLYFLQRIPFAISLLFCCLFACTIYHFIYAHLHNSAFASSSFVCFSSAYKLLSRHLSFSLSFLPLFLIPHFSFFPLLSFQSHFLIAPWIGFIRACSIVRYTSSSFLHCLPSPLLLSNFVLVFNFLHFSVQSSV